MNQVEELMATVLREASLTSAGETLPAIKVVEILKDKGFRVTAIKPPDPIEEVMLLAIAEIKQGLSVLSREERLETALRFLEALKK